MSTTVVRPSDPELGASIRLAGIFGVFILLFHVAANLYEAHIGYGYFRDEMYYLICGRRLAWGYVDHGPLVALQARASETLFGHSLAGLRLLSGLAGAMRVFLTGVLAWSLGGRRPAQGLAMICVAVAPQYLGTDSVLSMNSVESMFWMTCLLALILMERGGSSRYWLLFGASAGLGLLNKPSMTFFLLALLVALLLTPQRQLFRTRYAIAGTVILLVIALPNLVWQVQNHWPTFEFLRNGQLEHKVKSLSAPAFLLQQVLNLNPISLLVWGAGLVFLLRQKAWRWLGLTYLLFVLGMFAMHAKDYYVAPVYPILFAAGGVAWERRFAMRQRVQYGGWFAFPIVQTTLLATGLLFLPMSNPLLTPAQWIIYAKALHLYDSSSNAESASSGVLPQFYADRFGWQEEVDDITRIYRSLSPEDRKRVVLLCDNYGEASAINFLGRGLPNAISGQNNYWLWGPGQQSGDVVILIEDTTPEHLHLFFDQVEIAGKTGTTYSMPFEHKNIFLLRGPYQAIASLWPRKKDYI